MHCWLSSVRCYFYHHPPALVAQSTHSAEAGRMQGRLPKQFFRVNRSVFFIFPPSPPCTFLSVPLCRQPYLSTAALSFFVLPMSCYYSSPACFCSETTNHCLGSFCLGDKPTSVSYSGSQPSPATMSWRAHCLCLRLALVMYGSQKTNNNNKKQIRKVDNNNMQ